MSISGRVHYLAIGGLLIALSCAGESQAQSNSYPVDGQSEAKPPAIESYTAPDCQSPKSSEDANFCEQKRAASASEQQAIWGREQAKWSESQAFWTMAQFGLGFVGLGAVVVTLAYTVRATTAASRAAIAAEKTVFEVEAPFLYPLLVWWSNIPRTLAAGAIHGGTGKLIEPAAISVGFKIRNFGRTTAIVHSVRVCLECTNDTPSLAGQPGSQITMIEAALEAGSESSKELVGKSSSVLTRAEIAGIKAGEIRILLHGSIEYSSIQGASYVQTFCLTYSPPSDRFSPQPSSLNRRTRQQPETNGKKRWWQFRERRRP